MRLGCCLFAQRVEECLFDYTVDSYKATALNTRTRCLELKHALGEVRSGALPEKTLQPLFEELAWSIRTDLAVAHLLGGHAEFLSQPTSWSKPPLGDVGAQTDHILTRMASRRYEEALIAKLQDYLPNGKEKSHILRLANDLVVEWQTNGFSRDYIYMQTKGYFFRHRGRSIVGPADLDGFLRLFRRKATAWTVLMKVAKGIESIAPALPSGSVRLLEAVPAPRSGYRREADFLASVGARRLVEVKVPDARDARRASGTAEAMLTAITGVARLHAHRAELDWTPEALVYDDRGRATVLDSAPLAVHKAGDCQPSEFVERFESSQRVFHFGDRSTQSVARIVAAIGLHSHAVTARGYEAQLFCLWAALETLLPLEAASSRIDRICDCLLPVLAKQYPKKLLAALDADLTKCLNDRYIREVSQLPGDDRLEQCALLVCTAEFKPQRETIYAALEQNPLLRYRVFAIHDALNSAARIASTIDAHVQRVRWHLRRIYRSRNLLAHKGQALPYREAMVENLHSYVDRLFEALELVLQRDPAPRDIDEALQVIRLDYEAHRDVLQRASKEDCTRDNVKALLFGSRP